MPAKKNGAAQGKAREVSLSWFGKTLWKFSPIYLELIFLAVCLRLLGIVEPFIFQVIIDRILPFERESSLVVVVLVFATVGLFQVAFQVLSEILGILAANRIVRELGARIFDHLFKLPLNHFRKWSVGETMARVNETDAIQEFLVETYTGVFLDLIFASVYIAVLFTLSYQLTWIVLAALPMQILVYLCFGPFLRHRLRIQFDAGAAHQTQMVETISGITAVKALSVEKKILHRLDETLHASLNAGYRVSTINIWNEKLLFILEQTIKISIIYFGSQLVFAGELSLGQLIAFFLLAEKISEPIENFSNLWESWQNVRVSRQRLGDVLNNPIEPFDAMPQLPIEILPRLTFDSVDFAYDPIYPILKGFNFVAEPHTLTLMVGPSGSGKSTFGRLASGIDAPTKGRVLLGGENIANYEPRNIRSQIAYVPQEPYLFSGTLRENLTLGDDLASEAELERALRIAAADTLIAQLPKGIDTHVGERGSTLSGGQRQRIAIARSLLRRPKVIILDEPTSALDGTAQRQMAQELKALKTEATVIIITHTPETFEDPDQIVDFGAFR